jgi:hypothetical protein
MRLHGDRVQRTRLMIRSVRWWRWRLKTEEGQQRTEGTSNVEFGISNFEGQVLSRRAGIQDDRRGVVSFELVLRLPRRFAPRNDWPRVGGKGICDFGFANCEF